MSKCKKPECNADIFYGTTRTGAQMPLDVNPDPNGTIVIRENVVCVLKAHEVCDPQEKRYTSHFKTCCAAGEFRKRFKRGGNWQNAVEQHDRSRPERAARASAAAKKAAAASKRMQKNAT